VRWLLVPASVVPSSPILVTLMKEALISSETSVLLVPNYSYGEVRIQLNLQTRYLALEGRDICL
jgi:hypothetical protein